MGEESSRRKPVAAKASTKSTVPFSTNGRRSSFEGPCWFGLIMAFDKGERGIWLTVLLVTHCYEETPELEERMQLEGSAIHDLDAPVRE